MWGPWHITLGGDAATWWLVGATFFLAGVTGGLAWAAWRALGQLKTATEQLNAMKLDRHVQVFSDMGNRWASQEMTDALQMQVDYTPQSLARLFKRAAADRSRNPIRDYRRRQAEKKTVVLLRVANYFEEAGTIADIGSLEPELVDNYFGGVAEVQWKLWGEALRSFRTVDEEAWVVFERMAKQDAKEDV